MTDSNQKKLVFDSKIVQGYLEQTINQGQKKLVFDPNTGELVETGELVNPDSIPDSVIADQIAEEGFFGGPSPDDIVSLLLAAIYLCGSVTLSINLIKLRIEKEKVKKIRIKKGIYELEIYGSMSEKEIGNRIEQFRKLLRDVEIEASDIHIYTDKYFERIDSYHEHDYQKKGD